MTRSSTWISQLTALVAAGFYFYFTLKAVFNPELLWDSWAYHLPFSSYLWGLGGGQTSFQLPNAYFEPTGVALPRDRFEALPLLGEWLQGLFWTASGHVERVVLPNVLLFAVYAATANILYQVRLSLLVLLFFSVPLLAIHYFSS